MAQKNAPNVPKCEGKEKICMEKNDNFETKMIDLEKIVTELETGNLSLEDSLNKFEEGMKISKDCSKLLEDAEKRITIILEKNGELKEEDFIAEE